MVTVSTEVIALTKADVLRAIGFSGAKQRIILGPGLATPDSAMDVKETSFLKSDDLPELVTLRLAREWRQTVEEFFGAHDFPDTAPDVFRRYVLPAASVLATMRRVVNENDRNGLSTRFIVCGPPPVKRIRVIGSWSPELPRGDRNVAAAGLMAILREATDFTVELLPSRSLLLRAKFLVWYPALRALNAVSLLRLILRLALLAFVRPMRQQQDSVVTPDTVLVLARTAAQTRVACRIYELLASEGIKTQVVFLPPAFRGSVRADLKCARELRSLRWSVPSIGRVLGGIISNGRGPHRIQSKIDHEAHSLPTNLTFRLWAPYAHLEIQALSVHEYSRDWLQQSVKGSRGVVSFEVRGREAMLLRRVVAATKVWQVGLQVVVVPGTTAPWFPPCDVFFCASPSVRDYLKKYSLSPDRIEFAGLIGDKLNRASLGGDEPPRVLLATQPSSPRVMSDIVSHLQQLELAGAILLRVRLHPRDRLRWYPKEVRRVLRSHLSANLLDEDLSQADVVVAAYSSVATEAAARGLPILLCDFGHNAKDLALRELEPLPGSLHIASDRDGMTRYFQRSWEDILEEAQLVRTHMFGNLEGDLGAQLAAEFRRVRDG